MSNNIEPVGDGYTERVRDDVLFYKCIGTVDAEETAALMRRMAELMDDCGRAFMLVDMVKASTVTARGRRQMVNYAKDRPFSGLAVFGASFQMRVVIGLAMNALNLLRKSPQPLCFVETREEAEAWIAAERDKLAAES